jgi:hypothetical protein
MAISLWRHTACVLVVALLCGVNARSADETEEVFAGNVNCVGTGRVPEEVRNDPVLQSNKGEL